jgi:uncharacterized membrane protein YoaK (UPF0700 family)
VGAEGRALLLAGLLALLAGSVDAIGFLRLGHLFVAFMGGNTTTLSVAVAHGRWREAAQGGALVVLFTAGAAAGGVLDEATGRWHVPLILALVAALLALAAGGWPALPVLLMALAMGALNVAIHRVGPASVGPSYVTGALGKLGEGFGLWVADRAAGRGREGLDWAIQGVLWLGLVASTAAGTGLVAGLGDGAPWVPAGAALLLAGAAPILHTPS